MSASSAIIRSIWRRFEASPGLRLPSSSRSPLTFRLTKQVNFPPYWPSIGVDYDDAADAGGRALLSPQPYTTQDLDPLQNTFTPVRPLRVGMDRWAQVYLGTLRSSDPACGLKEKENVVLKLYDMSCYPVQWYIPDDEDYNNKDFKRDHTPLEDTSPGSCRMTEELMAWTEAWSYKKMGGLQGRVVPRFIGSFKVQLPGSGSELFATAMSYISGIHLVDLVKSLSYGKVAAEDHKEWYPYARELFKAIYDFHQMGICEFDIRSSNILVVQDHGHDQTPNETDLGMGCRNNVLNPEPEARLRFIDFTLTRPTTFPCFDERERSDLQSRLGKEDDIEDASALCDVFIEKEEGFCKLQSWDAARKLDMAYWKFIQWMARNHPEDAWVAEMWEPYWRVCARYSPSHTPVFANKLCRIS